MKISASDIFDSLRKSGRVPVWVATRAWWCPQSSQSRTVRSSMRSENTIEGTGVRYTDVVQMGPKIHYFEHQPTGKVWGIKVK